MADNSDVRNFAENEPSESEQKVPELKDFTKFPRQYIALNSNPIVCVPPLPTEREKRDENETDADREKREKTKKELVDAQITKKIFDLRSSMEGPVEYVITDELEFDPSKENLANVNNIVSQIYESLEKEDLKIKTEINDLKKNNLSLEDIQSGTYDLSGTSQTSLLIYVNEYLNKKPDAKGFSFLSSPGEAIKTYIKEHYTVEDGKWIQFPKILLRAMTSNTYFFTRMVEICQYSQVKDENNHLKQCAQIMYQCFKKGIKRRFEGHNVQRSFYYVKNQKDYQTLFTCVLMPSEKYKVLLKLMGNYKAKEGKKFILPGFITANKTKEDCFKQFTSPFGNHGSYTKVLFKINIDQDGKKDGLIQTEAELEANKSLKKTYKHDTRTTFINLCKKDHKDPENALTLETKNEQVLFALPMFAIKSHQEFKEDWFYPISADEKKEYEMLWNDKYDTDSKNERLFFKFKYTLNDNDSKKPKWSSLNDNDKIKLKKEWANLISIDKIVQEDISVTRNRPFYVFQVDQISYKEQFMKFSKSLDDLNLLAILGEGAFGQVFLSKQGTDYYAVKMLMKSKIIGNYDQQKCEFKGDMTKQVRKEIETMKTIRHPNLLGLNYITKSDDAVFISMPFSQAGDVRDLYKTVKETKATHEEPCYFHEKQILWWAKQMIEGVGELHKNELIHRDLKMDNILIQSDMTIVVCDFGLVVQYPQKDANHQNIEDGKGKFLKINQFAGTVSTMSPQAQMVDGKECAEGYGLETDWWSIGIVLYQLMYLRNPFACEDNSQDLTDIEKEAPRTKEEIEKLKDTDSEETKQQNIEKWRLAEKKTKELVRRVKDKKFTIAEGEGGDDDKAEDDKGTKIRVDWDTDDERYGKESDRKGYKIYSKNLRNLVAGLLTRIPEDRLGSKNGHEEILKHEAFELLKNKDDGSPADLKENFQTGKSYDLTKDFDKLAKKAKDAITAKNEKIDVTNKVEVDKKLVEFDILFADLFAKEEPKKEKEAEVVQNDDVQENKEASQSGVNSTVANSAAGKTEALSQVNQS